MGGLAVGAGGYGGAGSGGWGYGGAGSGGWVVGWLTARVVGWLTARVEVVVGVGTSANSFSYSPPFLAPSIKAELLLAKESRMWIGATDALPPIAASSSEKLKIGWLVILFVGLSSACHLYLCIFSSTPLFLFIIGAPS